MTQNEFNVVLEQQYRKCADVLVHKKKEYTGDRIDRLSAFKIAASLQGCTPKTALAGMMSKHVVSLYDMFSIMITFGRKLKHLSDTFRRRNTAYRFVGTAPQAVSKGA